MKNKKENRVTKSKSNLSIDLDDFKIESYITEVDDDALRSIRGGTGDGTGTSYNSCVIKCNTGSQCSCSNV